MGNEQYNLWESYGFRGNPFQTYPLSINEEIELSVKNAYISRSYEVTIHLALFRNFFLNPGGGRIIVEGEPGVGKTTFVNFFRHKWYKEEEHFFTTGIEIQITEGASPEKFLTDTIYALLASFRIRLGEEKFLKDDELVEMTKTVAVHDHNISSPMFGVQVFGSGVQFGKTVSSNYVQGSVNMGLLQSYLSLIVTKAKRMGFKGLILHYDNLDIVRNNYLVDLFEKIRDVIQMPDIYFVFVGGRGLFQEVIYPLERVRSIFQNTPITIESMSLDTVKSIIDRRYEIFSFTNQEYIKPIEDQVVDLLFEVYTGKLRLIMNDMTNLINMQDNFSGTIPQKVAMERLREIKRNDVYGLKMQPSVTEIFLKSMDLVTFNATKLAKHCGVSRTYIQNECLPRYLDRKLIFEEKKVRNSMYYRVSDQFRILFAEPQ